MELQMDKTFPLLETERIRLRQLMPSDAPGIFRLRADKEHNTYVDRPLATDISDAVAFIDKITGMTANGQSWFWVLEPKDSVAFAGTIAIWNFSGEHRSAELGFELLPGYQGQGLMKEATRAALGFAFRELQLKFIEAWVHPENQRSISLLNKLGFRRSDVTVTQAEAGNEVIYILDNDHS